MSTDSTAQPSTPSTTEPDYDVVIIGSGFGGSVSALRLVEKGYKEYMWGHFQSRFFFPPEYVKARPDVLETLFKTFWDHRPQLDPYLRHVIARNQHETGNLLHKITTPTLVLHGTRDRIVPYKVGAEIAEAIPATRFVTFEGGGHGLPGREAVSVTHLIRDFGLERPVEVEGSVQQP